MNRWKLPTMLGATLVGVVGLGLVATAANAADPISGETTVVLDFSVSGQVDVSVYTKNLSSVPAYGWAAVQAPSGTVYHYGPKLYQAGEVWTYDVTLSGYTCADLPLAAAAAYGGSTTSTVEWTSGEVTYPDPRVTVIGCDVTTPTASPSPQVATPTPTVTATATPVATASPSPQAGTPSPSPTTQAATPTATATTTATATPAATSGDGDLAATGGVIGWGLIAAAVAALAAVGGGTLMARRRAS